MEREACGQVPKSSRPWRAPTPAGSAPAPPRNAAAGTAPKAGPCRPARADRKQMPREARRGGGSVRSSPKGWVRSNTPAAGKVLEGSARGPPAGRRRHRVSWARRLGEFPFGRGHRPVEFVLVEADTLEFDPAVGTDDV